MHESGLNSIIPSVEFQTSGIVKNAAKNLNKLAIPVIALVGLTIMSAVEGGTYYLC